MKFNINTKVKNKINHNQEFLNVLIDKKTKRISKIANSLVCSKIKESINQVKNPGAMQQTSFISIIYSNGIQKCFEITAEEILILKTAINHSYGYINLRGRREAIKSLISKGLVELKFDERIRDYDLSISKVAEVAIKQNRELNYPFLLDELLENLNPAGESAAIDKAEDKNIAAISWCVAGCED